jgi:DNA-binding CsgD family transcriptional regulator
LGILFTNQGDHDRALSYLFRSLEAGERRSDQHGLAANYSQIGKVYFMKNDWRQASTYLERGKVLAEQFDLKKTLKDIYETLKDLEIAKGNAQKALSYYEKYEQVKESLFNEEMALRIANLQTQHAIDSQKQVLQLRDKEITLLEEKDRKNKVILFLSVLLLVLFGILIYRSLRNQLKKNRKALSTEKELRERQEIQLESEKEKIKELSKELDQRNKELTAYTVNFIRKNELIGDIRATISDIRKSTDRLTASQLDTLERKLKNAFHIDEDWESFRTYFEQVHQQFFPIMKSHHPNLSNNDLKLCILARLNLDIKEMATMLGISPNSVKTARYRLRKKMNIQKEDSILSYLLRLEGKGL